MAFGDIIYSDWSYLAMGFAIISVIIAILLILIARLFNQPEFETTAKAELTYAVSSVLIVVLVMALIGVVEPLLASGTPGTYSLSGGGAVRYSVAQCLFLSGFNLPCSSGVTITDIRSHKSPSTLIDWMEIYMQTPESCVQNYMNELYVLSIPAETGATVFLEIFMSEHASGFGFKYIAERINNASMTLSFYTYIYYIITYVLNFIRSYAGFFFSLGVVMRAFPPTRGGGAYVMALSIGLYFVLPLTYILTATMALPYTQAQIISYDLTQLNTAGNFGYTCTLPHVSSAQATTRWACEGPSIARAFEWRDRLLASSSTLDDMLTFRLGELTRHMVAAICIFPMISMVVLITFVLNATSLFGGNVPEVGRGLVKLI